MSRGRPLRQAGRPTGPRGHRARGVCPECRREMSLQLGNGKMMPHGKPDRCPGTNQAPYREPKAET